MPCTKSELDLDSMLPLQIGMVNVYLVQTSPKLGPDGGGPLEFQILSSGDDYQDLSHCYLYLKCQVLKANGLPIKSAKFTGWEATFGPMNLLFHSLFRQVDLVMNNILVATSGETYLYGAYLTMLAGYGCQAKKTWLKHLEGWAMDEAEIYNVRENWGLVQHLKIVKNSKALNPKGCLHSDMLLQERLVPNNMNMILVLSWIWLAFHLIDWMPDVH